MSTTAADLFLEVLIAAAGFLAGARWVSSRTIGQEYFRGRALAAEALLAGTRAERCGHECGRDSGDIRCALPLHTGGYHGACGIRWDDTGALRAEEDESP
jgi:hypothetical protein